MNKKYKIYSRIGVVLAVVVFVLANVLMTVISKKVPTEVDLTSNKRYELSETSYEFLDKYDTDTKIYIIASPTDEDKDVRAVINKYGVANSHITIQNIDFYNEPAFGREYLSENEKLELNSVIVTAGDKSRIIYSNEFYTTDHEKSLNVEPKITSALKYVSETGSHKAYFTTGHNEDDFMGAVEALESENYELWKIALSTTDIPADASVLIIAHPTLDFTNDEIAKMDEYVRSGGNVQVYVNADVPTLPNLNAYLEKNGIIIRDNIIVDQNAHVGNSTFLMNYADNAVTDKIYADNRYSAYMGFSKWIDYSATSGMVSVTEYLTSMSGASTMKSLTELADDGIIHSTSPAIALMSENIETGGKIFVCGNTMLLDFGVSEITDAGYDNIVYFTALTNSMCKESTETFVVPVKSMEESRLVILESAQRVWLGVIIVIPAVLLISGIAVFFRRRNM